MNASATEHAYTIAAFDIAAERVAERLELTPYVLDIIAAMREAIVNTPAAGFDDVLAALEDPNPEEP